MTISSRRLVPATLLALLASLLFAVPARAADTGSVSGVVTARPSGGTAAPYAGASILFDRLHETGGNDNALVRAESDSTGHFSVAEVPDGRYQIRIYPDGYVHGAAELGDYGYEYYNDKNGPYGSEVVVVTGGQAVTLDPIELRPIGHVVGRVLDEQGQPVQGGVMVAPAMAGGSSTHTDADGYYDTLDGEWSENLIPGDYEASFNADGWGIEDPQYYYESKPVVVTAGGTATVNFTVKRRPTATFTVLDTDGTPLAEAPLRIDVRDPRYNDGAWGPIQSGPHATDAQGRYRFTDNFAEYRFQVSPPDGYAGPGLPEYWDDAATVEQAAVLSFPDGVALDRQFTIRLDPPTVVPPVVDPPVVVPPVVVPPVVGALRTNRPRVVGAARVGRKLVASVKPWSPAPVKLAFQWLRDGKPIKKRTARSYRLGKADLGHRISVRVVGRKASYATATVKSPATAKVRR
jgi:hypothetical protein